MDTRASDAKHPGTGLTVPALAMIKRLRQAHDWRQEIDDVLAILGRSFGCHRSILFQMREIHGRGFAQSMAGLWVDVELLAGVAMPTLIVQDMVVDDPFLEQVAQDVRQGRAFAGHTRQLQGFLREDFERQRIRSFLSAPIFAHGHLWGTLAVNDCVAERYWSEEEVAGLDLVACAVGDAIERSASEDHVSEIFRTTMVQAALDGIVVIDETGSIIEFNPAAERMFGWLKPEVVGRDIAHLLVPEEHRAGHRHGMSRYLAGGPAVMIGRRVETHARNAADETFPVELTISDVRAAGRHLFVGSIRDLRERQRAEEEINRQRDRLHQNEKMAAMGSLLAGVSHELNNPLAVVVAQSTLLYEFATDPQVRTRAEKVRAAAERCGRIVKSFLGMVRLHPSAQAETDLNQVLRAALEVTAYGARSAGIAVETSMSPGTLQVMADADHLTQVAANFLVNAQHALAAIAGERRIRLGSSLESDGTVRFWVEDNGPGIAPEIAGRIFEPYFTTKPVGVGTGIGLSISRSIVERHNGRVWLEAAEGGGARFVVELPSAEGRASDPAVGTSAQSGIREALIVDDEPDVAASLADILEMMGVKSTVMHRWAGIPSLAGRMPDVVFSDLRMPGATGLDIHRELALHHPLLASRFVLVTGDMVGAKTELEQMPAETRPLLLEKPFNTLDIRSVLAVISDGIA